MELERRELSGIEIPAEFAELFRCAVDALAELEKRAEIELSDDIRIGFAEDVATCGDAQEVRMTFLNYFNQVFIEYDLEGVVDAENLLSAVGLLEQEG